MKSFASDNTAGVHPAIFEALSKVNQDTAPAYGEDPWTNKAVTALQQHFGAHARCWLVFLGTAANVLGLKSITRSHEAVICAETAHIYCDECGAPEAITGSKLLPVPSHNGKVSLVDCERLLCLRESVHHPYPKILSIAQSTECGTVYSIDELREISRFCRKHGLYLHMDGARLANAAAYLGCSLRAISTEVGVDVLSFGGTKNGLMFGEAIVFLNPELGHNFAYLRKQHMQLLSKMRYMAAQFIAYLENDLWLTNAQAANSAAQKLATAVQDMEHVRLVYPVQGNALFVRLHKETIAQLERDFYFYTLDKFNAVGYPKDWHLVRWMTSFNTTDSQVAAFAQAIQACAPGK